MLDFGKEPFAGCSRRSENVFLFFGIGTITVSWAFHGMRFASYRLAGCKPAGSFRKGIPK